MSRKDRFHELVKQALIQTGWKITDDPLYLSIGNVNIQIDLAAEPLIAATKDERKIAVEVKSFISASQITDFYGALGQYLILLTIDICYFARDGITSDVFITAFFTLISKMVKFGFRRIIPILK